MDASSEPLSIIQFQNNLCEKLAFEIFPNCEDYGDNIDKMCERMWAIQQYIKGELPPDTFLDIIDSHGFDVHQVIDDIEIEICSR